MAVIDELPGVEVCVCVDEEPLYEHVDRHATVKKGVIERYIEAKSDQQFTIRIVVDPTTKFLRDCLTFGVQIDGEFVRTYVVGVEDCRFTRNLGILRGKPAQNHGSCSMSFSALETGKAITSLDGLYTLTYV